MIRGAVDEVDRLPPRNQAVELVPRRRLFAIDPARAAPLVGRFGVLADAHCLDPFEATQASRNLELHGHVASGQTVQVVTQFGGGQIKAAGKGSEGTWRTTFGLFPHEPVVRGKDRDWPTVRPAADPDLCVAPQDFDGRGSDGPRLSASGWACTRGTSAISRGEGFLLSQSGPSACKVAIPGS